MNAETWLKDTKKWMRRLAVPMLALALVASFVTYEFAKPAAARAAEAAPSAAPLDADSVGALLALDKAMETLAARVTPAVVNVTVTSRTKPDMAGRQLPQDMQQFFGGQGSPFGQFFFGPRSQRQPQIELPLAGEDVGDAIPAQPRQMRVGDLFRQHRDDLVAADIGPPPGDLALGVERDAVSGGVAPGGSCLSNVCEIAVTWALAVRISTLGWKKILTMPNPL